MGAPRKYTKKKLSEAVQKYFDSISREKTVTEKVPTKEKDSEGHTIYEDIPVYSKLGEKIVVTEYVVPPTVGGLCQFLGITRETWSKYCDKEEHPEFSDTTTRARGRMRAWNEEQLLVRAGKDIKGIIFNLENNYGYGEKSEVVLGGRIEDFLQQLDAGGDGGREF